MPPVKVNHIESAWPTIITREVKRVRKSKNGQNLGFTSSIYALKSIWSKGGAGHLASLFVKQIEDFTAGNKLASTPFGLGCLCSIIQ